ncbi:hypothetical protein [Nonomuraea turcica]|uniref:hypothetical protein n=1 Tax=Nonomuraea sp. G32 TaxID=3067274 RepID=UPI00273BCE59|nr:hypothetical protein [Nonomuraea sp. G32]MDP4511634.1 hypothetical protein [Nonomuraea sp. G32]
MYFCVPRPVQTPAGLSRYVIAAGIVDVPAARNLLGRPSRGIGLAVLRVVQRRIDVLHALLDAFPSSVGVVGIEDEDGSHGSDDASSSVCRDPVGAVADEGLDVFLLPEARMEVPHQVGDVWVVDVANEGLHGAGADFVRMVESIPGHAQREFEVASAGPIGDLGSSAMSAVLDDSALDVGGLAVETVLAEPQV